MNQSDRNSSPIKNKGAINKISTSQNCQSGVKGQRIQQTLSRLAIDPALITHPAEGNEEKNEITPDNGALVIWDKTGKGYGK